MKKIILGLLFSISAFADTPAPGVVSIKGGTDNTKIGNVSDALKVSVVNGTSSSTANQGTPNAGGSNAWYVQGSLGKTWDLTSSADSVTAFQGGAPWSFNIAGGSIANTAFGISGLLPAFAATPTVNSAQSGSWTVGVNNFPTTQAISAAALPLPNGAATDTKLGTIITNLGSPFQAGGSIGNTTFASTQSGTWNVGVNNFPSSQAVTGNLGRTWSLSSGTDSVAVTGSITASNPSIGSNASTAPTSSTQIGGQDGSGNLQPLQVNASKALKVDGSAVTQPVSGTVAVSNFPSTQNVNVTNSSIPVTGTFYQATQPVSISGTPTVNANQSGTWTTGRTWSLSSGTDSVAISGSVTATNSANGNTGSTAPAQATQIGGSDGTNLQALQVDGSKNLKVVLQGTSTVTANAGTNLNTSALALESGGHLASIDTKTPSLGQALSASSVPVVLPAAQITTLTPPTSVTVTQATGTNLHSVIDSGSVNVGNFPASQTVAQSTAANLNATVVQSTGSNLHANIDNFPGTQTVSGSVTVTQATGTNLHSVIDSGSVTATISGTPTVTANAGTNLNTSALALESGGHLASLDTKAPALGSAVTSSSVPVNIASDQTVSIVNADVTASGTITTQNLVPAGTATAGSAVAVALNGKGTVTIQVTGSYTGALSPQVTTDGTNWITQGGTVLQNMATGASSATIPSASVGIWQIEINGHAQFRITALAAVTGTATITLRAAAGTSQVSAAQGPASGIANAWPTKLTDGTNTAAVKAASTAALATDPAVVVSLSPNSQSPAPKGYILANAPVYNSYSSTPVTTSAYVQLVASTSLLTNDLEIFDSSGQGMILATGSSGSEVIQAYIPPGGASLKLQIPAGTRVAYKALTANASGGYLIINFLE